MCSLVCGALYVQQTVYLLNIGWDIGLANSVSYYLRLRHMQFDIGFKINRHRLAKKID